MNPVGIIGVIILAVILDVPWALYYLATQFVFLFVRDEYLLVSIIGMIPPIYFGLPWWYDLLLFQHFLFVCASRSSAESFLEGKMDEIEADGVRRVAYHVSSALMFISVIGSCYWLVLLVLLQINGLKNFPVDLSKAEGFIVGGK